jgi:nicotinate-nucleotide adenylyltransferase
MQRIAGFGGTFDPVHQGHLELARRAAEALALDQVRFLPCRRSPHKPDPPQASDAARAAMLDLAVADLPWAVVDRFELEAPEPSYSYRTARHLRQLFPAARLFWIVGLDQWQALPRWARPAELADTLEFLVFSRDGEPSPRPGWRMTHVPGDHPASATAIRQTLHADGGADRWLPPPVAAYIRDHSLYR